VPVPVLVVEDDPAVRETVFLVLTEEGYTVHTAEHGVAALERIRWQSFGLILLDMEMPVMNGWTFAAAYRSLFTVHAPIVVMSGASDARARAVQVQANACVAKPFDFDRLIDTVAQWTQSGSGTR